MKRKAAKNAACHRPRDDKATKECKVTAPKSPCTGDPLTLEFSPERILRDWSNEALQQLLQEAQKKDPKRHLDMTPEIHHVCALPCKDLEACLDIIRYTSMSDYKASSIGWHEPSKRKEMLDRAMIYIILRAAPEIDHAFAPSLSGNIVGFASFMLTNDDPPHSERTVAYIYEVHIGEGYRGCGLGRFLVLTVETMAELAGIGKTMLTVFTCNAGAVAAYKRMGYEKDQCSPLDRETRGRVIKADYIIMGKQWNLAEQ